MKLFEMEANRVGKDQAERSAFEHQKGVALLLVLFLCVILGVIGITVTSSSTSQTQMAVSVLDQDIAFQSAETALRSGELWIASRPSNLPPLLPVVNCVQPCVEALGGLPANPWPGAANVAGVAGLAGVRGARTAPQFVIEYISNLEVWQGGSVPLDEIGESTGREEIDYVNFYRVTARGTGRTNQAQAIVQSVYAW